MNVLRKSKKHFAIRKVTFVLQCLNDLSNDLYTICNDLSQGSSQASSELCGGATL